MSNFAAISKSWLKLPTSRHAQGHNKHEIDSQQDNIQGSAVSGFSNCHTVGSIYSIETDELSTSCIIGKKYRNGDEKKPLAEYGTGLVASKTGLVTKSDRSQRKCFVFQRTFIKNLFIFPPFNSSAI